MKRLPLRKCYLIVILLTVTLIPRLVDLDSPGLTWDEPVYIEAGKLYVRNLLSGCLFSEYWWYNWEHPPLMKYLIGINVLLMSGYLNEVSTARIPNAILGAIASVAFFLFMSFVYGDMIGVLAALSLSFYPRFFAHTRYAALDAPEAAFWILTFLALWHGRSSGNRRWLIISGIFFGLALSVKVNAITLPLTIFFWILFTYDWREFKWRSLTTFVVNSLFFIVPALSLFVFSWPLLWHDPLRRVSQFLSFHIHHFKIPVFYLGKVYEGAPWHYPIVMLLVSTPIFILIPALIGLVSSIKSLFSIRGDSRDSLNVLLLFWLLIPITRTAISSYGYDGIRLFLEAVPPLIGLSAVGANQLICLLRRHLKPWSTLASYFIILSMISSCLLACVFTHPYQIAYFNEIVRLSVDVEQYFEPIYWGEPYRECILWLEEHNDDGFVVLVPFADHLAKYYAHKAYVVSDVSELFNSLCSYNHAYVLFMLRTGLVMRNPLLTYCMRKLKPMYTVNSLGLNLAYVYDMRDLLSLYNESLGATRLHHLLSLGTFLPLDISRYCNRGLKDELPNDLKGGWVDDGTDDLRYLPRGLIHVKLPSLMINVDIDIPFSVPKRDPACIVLRSSHKPQFPTRVSGISVGMDGIEGIIFLHTAVHATELHAGSIIGYYEVIYADGSEVRIPLRIGVNVLDWHLEPIPLEESLPAWIGRNKVHHLTVVYAFPWINPFPEKKIAHINFVSTGSVAVPVLLAITLILK